MSKEKHPGLVLTPQGWREPFKPDPHRLSPTHDYHSRCMYLITMNARDDARIFGTLAGGLTSPHIEMTLLGQEVERILQQISAHYPETQLVEYVIMPNHLHFVLFTREQNDKALGDIIRGMKIAANKAKRALCADGRALSHNMEQGGTSQEGTSQGGTSQEGTSQGFIPVFASRFHHYILWNKGELESWLGYIRSNPYRLAYRNAFAKYYNVQRNVQIGTHTYDMVGNSDLLKRPLVQVLVHRSEFNKATNKPTSDAARDRLNSLILQARKGAVLISPFISPGELAIRDVAIKEGLPMIMMLNHGLNDKYKPSKAFFDMCHKGSLLQITPWTYKYGEDEKGYDRFHKMNDLVAEICAGK